MLQNRHHCDDSMIFVLYQSQQLCQINTLQNQKTELQTTISLSYVFFYYDTLACFEAMASLTFHLQHPLLLVAAFWFHIWSQSTAPNSILPTIPHFPTGLLPPKHPSITFLVTQESSTLTTWLANCNFFRCKNVESTTSPYHW